MNPKRLSRSHKAPPCTAAVLSYLYPALISCSSHTSTILQWKCPCSRPESTSDSLPHPWLQATFLFYLTRSSYLSYQSPASLVFFFILFFMVRSREQASPRSDVITANTHDLSSLCYYIQLRKQFFRDQQCEYDQQKCCFALAALMFFREAQEGLEENGGWVMEMIQPLKARLKTKE